MLYFLLLQFILKAIESADSIQLNARRYSAAVDIIQALGRLHVNLFSVISVLFIQIKAVDRAMARRLKGVVCSSWSAEENYSYYYNKLTDNKKSTVDQNKLC